MNLVAESAKEWETIILRYAQYIFWTLGTISLVITYGTMLVRKADLGEFFAETIRFMLFFGFFLWLLQNGPAFANDIISSLRQIATQAGRTTSETREILQNPPR